LWKQRVVLVFQYLNPKHLNSDNQLSWSAPGGFEAVKLSFILTRSGPPSSRQAAGGQNIRDEDLMKSLIKYLGCGYTTLENRGTIDFKVLCVNLDIGSHTKRAGLVTKISNIRDVIIPFFNKYPLQGIKSKDFADFCKVFLADPDIGRQGKRAELAVDIVGNKARARGPCKGGPAGPRSFNFFLLKIKKKQRARKLYN
jgi:hypothetical protein